MYLQRCKHGKSFFSASNLQLTSRLRQLSTAAYRRDFEKVKNLLMSNYTGHAECSAILMAFVHFYYNNIPREMIDKYQDEENHFKKLDLTARKLEKSVNYERRSTHVSAGDFTHNILLRAVTALEIILRNEDQNLVSQLHGINSRLSAAKFSVKEWAPLELNLNCI